MRGEGRRRFFMEGLVMRAKFNIPIYWIIVSIAHALTWYRRSQERERSALQLEARLADARLEALRMQLHPHFLFNTLNAISTLVHRDPHAADEMIGNLSELLRATLDTTAQEIPLHQELHFLDQYLEIQQLRFGDRLQVEKEIDATALEVKVPTLILQPLVENAIRHGIEPQTGQGKLRITAACDGQTLRLRVCDNGPAAKPAAEGKAGIGLANTRSRLKELYGQSASLTLTTGSDGGFVAAIDIPCREASSPGSDSHPSSSHENPNPDRR
jgi:LytS/YehU family sensor histidine kinase